MEPAIRTRLARFYDRKNVLVTGGASFIGSHLTEMLVAAGARVTVVDDLSSGRLEHLTAVQSSIDFRKGDVRDRATIEGAVAGKQIVFHLAAAHGGRGYIDTHPVECVNNMVVDHSTFAAAARAGVEKIVHASSACVYPINLQADEADRLLLRETDANFEEAGKAFSDGEYGWAKLMGELQLRAFTKQYGLSGVACRIFTAYGERENESHAAVALIAKAALRMDPYPIWGNGLQTRNFTHVEDTATGIALSGESLGGFETINVGTDQHHTILDLIEEIFSEMGWRPSTIKRELDKPVGVKSRAADVEKCRTRLGWVPSVSLKDGVRRTTRWYLERFDPRTAAELERRLMERA
ncbi:MAG: SDR family NAD(P)-dependent oxidoreductase [Deltaproteobacteria bacterium]|nr:SDR family NAD(P)-dependent oxidoreductase [Deltaproteobacteria bacterium]